MTTETPNPNPEKPQGPTPFEVVRILALVAMISGFLIVVGYQFTLPIILKVQQETRAAAVLKVIPGASSYVEFYLSEKEGLTRVAMDGSTVKPEGQVDSVYAGYDKDGKFVGIALEGAAQGYQSKVRTMFGYLPSCECIVGITYLENKETPGFGDKVDKDADFIANFKALEVKLNADKTALANPVVTVKHGTKRHPWQIDAISGSTITSKAVGKGINNSAQRLLPMLRYHLDEFELNKK